MGEVTRMEMEFLYFETWGNEACSLEQLCFSTEIYSVVLGCASRSCSVAAFVLVLGS